MNVTSIGWLVGLGGLKLAEILYPVLFEPPLQTDAERCFVVSPDLEVLAQQRE